jgi:hypothetical protein
VNWPKVAADFLKGPGWPPRDWLDMTVVQWLCMAYLSDSEPGKIPVYGRGDEGREVLRLLVDKHKEDSSPGRQLERAEALFARYHGVQTAGDGG